LLRVWIEYPFSCTPILTKAVKLNFLAGSTELFPEITACTKLHPSLAVEGASGSSQREFLAGGLSINVDKLLW
jgi:hypothetical protein